MFSWEPVNWAEGISAISSVLTLFGAAWGLTLWRAQLRGTSKHGVAIEAATAARALSTAFFEARSPVYLAWEFPDEYMAQRPGDRSNDDEAKAWAHVYENRWKVVHGYALAVVQLRAKVGAVLGSDLAEEMDKLARQAHKLTFWMTYDLDQKRDGREAVKRWTNQEMVKATPDYLTVGEGRDDKFSNEFGAILDPLLEKLRKHT